MKLGIVFILLLIFSLLGFILYSDVAIINSVIIEGIDYLSPEDVHLLASIEKGMHIFKIRVSHAEESLKASPWVLDAKVERKGLKTVMISIAEDKSIAVIPNNSSFIMINKRGQVLDVLNFYKGSGEIFLTGLNIADAKRGDVPFDNHKYGNIIRIINYFHEIDFSPFISELNVDKDGNIIVYTLEGIKLLFGKDILGYKYNINVAYSIYMDLRREKVTTGVIDLRFKGNPVYRQK